MGTRWVEDELRSIDVDFRQQKMNAFGSSADTVADNIDELGHITSTLLLSSSSAMVSNGAKPSGEVCGFTLTFIHPSLSPNTHHKQDFMCTDMNESKFDDISADFRSKQRHIEDINGLMAHLAAKVSSINDCVHGHEDDE